MKKVLIIHAHPEKKSFCSALKDQAVAHFQTAGAEVKVSDLYNMGFNPVGDKHDFLELSNPDFFKYQAEQTNAFQKDLFTPEVKAEMEKFLWCDTLIFTFPLWWFGVPAIMKGWVDRVFAMGFSYGAGKGVYDSGTFKDKISFAVLTTGGPEIAYGPNGKNGNLETILYPVHHGMFYFVGMQTKNPFISFSPARLADEERKSELTRFTEYLNQVKNSANLF
ncbi:MAG: NAD(P)H-dependent oxidoreductase [Crocinitomicaceae bacterium]|nr:NAD(P)H-dependent oxidoreductase [Crocinitomicaceae bacterium]